MSTKTRWVSEDKVWDLKHKWERKRDQRRIETAKHMTALRLMNEFVRDLFSLWFGESKCKK